MAIFGHFDHFLSSKMAKNGRKCPIRSISKLEMGGIFHCNQARRSQRKKPRVDSTNECEASPLSVAFGESDSEPYYEYFFRFADCGSMTW